jgi:hypothetical protein
MRNPTHHHTAQMYTLFGGAYVAESHSANPMPRAPKTHSIGPMAAVLVALLAGTATTAAAITAASRIKTTDWGPMPPSILMKSPGMVGFGDALY